MSDDKTAWWLAEFVKDYMNKEYSSILDNENIQKYFGPCYSYYDDLNNRKAKLKNDKFIGMYIKEGKEVRPFFNNQYLSYDINLIRSSILLTSLTRNIFLPLDLSKKEDLEWKRKIEQLYGMTGFFLIFLPDENSEIYQYHPKQIYDFFQKKADFDFLKDLKEATSKFEYSCDVDLKELDKMEDWEILQLYTFRRELVRYRECLHLFNKKLDEIKEKSLNNDNNLN